MSVRKNKIKIVTIVVSTLAQIILFLEMMKISVYLFFLFSKKKDL
jgi:hypothetical protein